MRSKSENKTWVRLFTQAGPGAEVAQPKLLSAMEKIDVIEQADTQELDSTEARDPKESFGAAAMR